MGQHLKRRVNVMLRCCPYFFRCAEDEVFLLGLNLLLHVDELFLAIVKFVLQER